LFFAPNLSHHWAADGPLVLDAAALRNVLVVEGPDPLAESCLEWGSTAVTHLVDHYRHRVISFRTHKERAAIDRSEFESCARELSEAGIEIVPNLDQAWRQYESIRGHYAPQVALLTRMLPSN
jgi:hypothetical protein